LRHQREQDRGRFVAYVGNRAQNTCGFNQMFIASDQGGDMRRNGGNVLIQTVSECFEVRLYLLCARCLRTIAAGDALGNHILSGMNKAL